MAENRLIAINIRFLKQAIRLLEQITDEQFIRVIPTYFKSGVGKHLRHSTDHYDNFLSGLESGKINYDERQRDIGIEQNRLIAIRKLQSIIRRLGRLHDFPLDKPILVNSNEGESTNASQNWNASTFGRELQFLLSHTVHHYALIALILALLGFKTDSDFGVAPSTLKYERSQEE